MWLSRKRLPSPHLHQLQRRLAHAQNALPHVQSALNKAVMKRGRMPVVVVDRVEAAGVVARTVKAMKARTPTSRLT